MFTNIGLPDIERRKRKRNLLLGQPQGSLSERIDTPCACVDLQLTFSCGLPILRLIPDQFEWCIAAAGTCAIVVCVIVNNAPQYNSVQTQLFHWNDSQRISALKRYLKLFKEGFHRRSFSELYKSTSVFL